MHVQKEANTPISAMFDALKITLPSACLYESTRYPTLYSTATLHYSWALWVLLNTNLFLFNAKKAVYCVNCVEVVLNAIGIF